MSVCPRCKLDLTMPEPKVGQTWLRVDTRKLYVVTVEWKHASYATAERLHPRGPQGCDPTWQSAIWPNAVRAGEWILIDEGGST